MTAAAYDVSAHLGRRVLAEFVGTALLLIAVVGSGITAQTLSPSDTGLALMENAIATGAALVAIILAVGSVSGAHLNPIVSCVDAVFGGLRRTDVAWYVVAQVAGAATGVLVANLMFGLPAVNLSSHARFGTGLWLGEIIATLGLLLVVFGLVRSKKHPGGALRSRRLHHGRVLLHLIDELRQSRGHAGADAIRYVRRYCAGVGCGLYGGTAARCRGRMRPHSHSVPGGGGRCPGCGRAA
jgi:glycerol uptake facilitator-like aquaporin